jgi:nicotinamide-nucleotide amidase
MDSRRARDPRRDRPKKAMPQRPVLPRRLQTAESGVYRRPALGDTGPVNPKVELVSTGSELLSGRTVNRHAQTLGEALAPLGLVLARDTTVPDDAAAIADAIRGALGRAEIVIVSGGLGPTSDDLTRDVVADLFRRWVVMDESARRQIHERFAHADRPVTAMTERHALVVEGAEVLPNSAGLAPGERLEKDGRFLFLLPGPPREFSAILEEHVLPWLRANWPDLEVPHTRIFQVCGVGESDLVTRLVPRGFPGEGVEVAYCAQPGRVEIRVWAPPARQDAVEAAAAIVRETLGSFVFTEDRRDLAEVVGGLLLDRKATLGLAESCTGGLVGQRLTAFAGSSEFFLGGIIAYANASKSRDLAVRPDTLDTYGAVSAETARQMARGVRIRFGADFGLSVTGIAGPAGATDDKPVGLVFAAVADAAGAAAKEFRFPGGRSSVRDWASQMALDLLRRRLLAAS